MPGWLRLYHSFRLTSPFSQTLTNILHPKHCTSVCFEDPKKYSFIRVSGYSKYWDPGYSSAKSLVLLLKRRNERKGRGRKEEKKGWIEGKEGGSKGEKKEGRKEIRKEERQLMAAKYFLRFTTHYMGSEKLTSVAFFNHYVISGQASTILDEGERKRSISPLLSCC